MSSILNKMGTVFLQGAFTLWTVPYPPAALTNNSTTLSGQAFGNGVYTASASSTFNAGDEFRVFDKNTASTLWSNQTSNYTVNNGNSLGYATSGGGDFTTPGIGRGEWVQLTLPSQMILAGYNLTGWDFAKAPFSWVVCGSNDGTTWTALDTQTNVSNWVLTIPSDTKSYSILNNATPFIIYRIVITAVNTTSGSGFAQINEWVLRGIPIPPLPLDALSASALSSMKGAYSVKRLLASYTGPVLNIRRSTDNATSDFYSDSNGNLTTGANGTGTTYASWIGAGTGYVVTWYDQSGSGNHATQSTQASQPALDHANLRVNFASPTNAFLQIASPGCIPTGDGLYTCTLKHGSISGLGTFYGSGTNTAWNGCDFSYDTGQSRYWGGWGGGNDYGGGVTGNNNVLTYRYITAGGALASKEIWVNGVKGTTIVTSGSSNSARNSPAAINYIGRSLAYNNPFYANTQLNFICIASSSVSDADRQIMEAQ